MTKPAKTAPDVRASRLERLVSRLDDVEKYLREEADFNRSWTDGRRGANRANSEQYIAARITAANIRDEWADATAEAKKILENNPCVTGYGEL